MICHKDCSKMGRLGLHRLQQCTSVGDSMKQETLKINLDLPLYQLVFVEALSTSQKAKHTWAGTFPQAHLRVFILHSTEQAVKINQSQTTVGQKCKARQKKEKQKQTASYSHMRKLKLDWKGAKVNQREDNQKANLKQRLSLF